MGDIVISPAALVAITGLLSCLAGVVGFLYRAMIAQYEARLKEHKDTIGSNIALLKEQTTAIDRLSGVIDSWRPTDQVRRARG